MKNSLLFSLVVLASSPVFGFSGDGTPFKYISSCELDLNGDQVADKAVLVEGIAGRELLALIAKGKTYETFVVSKGREKMFLQCKIGPSVKESSAAGGTGKIVKTPGAYLELFAPESSSVAFVWNKGSFQEVWTGD